MHKEYIHLNTKTGNVTLHMESVNPELFRTMTPNPEMRFLSGLPPLSILEIETATRIFAEKHNLSLLIDGSEIK